MGLRIAAVATLLALVALAGCGGGDEAQPDEPGAGQPAEPWTDPRGEGGALEGAVEVAAARSGAPAFEQASLEAAAGDVTFEFTNPSTTSHALCVESADAGALGCTGQFRSGTGTLNVHLAAGEHTFFCNVHRDAGMSGTLTVR